MPLSQVYGAQSLIKAGVCTSSSRPASPFEGQLIYETDTDRLAAYNGSAWVTQNGLQVVKAETSFSAASSFSATNVFSASYKNYILAINASASASSLTLNLQLSVGGVAAATNYNIQKLTVASTTLTGARSTSQTSYGIDDDDPNRLVIIELGSPAVAEATTIMTRTTTGTSGALALNLSGGNHSTATAYDGFVVTASTGTITGTYTIYGLGVA